MKGSLTSLWIVAAALAVPRAAGFDLTVHRQILKQSLPMMTGQAFNEIDGDFFWGLGNQGSDAFQFDAFRHFDNAEDSAAVCARANRAWSFFISDISYGLTHGEIYRARSSFGGLTHAIQDFYSHSNWLEIGQRNSAPLFPVCYGTSLPNNLQTGYFQPSLEAPLSGCPRDLTGAQAPPSPFLNCHAVLNKDLPTGHGADLTAVGGPTYHHAAVTLALADTVALIQKVRTVITTTVTPVTADLNGDCLIDLTFGVYPNPPISLAQPDHLGTCLDLSGIWTNVGSSPPNVGGALWSLTRVNVFDITGYVQTQTCGQVALSAHRDSIVEPYVGTLYSCPIEAEGACSPVTSLPLQIEHLAFGRVRVTLTAQTVEESATECRAVEETYQYISLQR